MHESGPCGKCGAAWGCEQRCGKRENDVCGTKSIEDESHEGGSRGDGCDFGHSERGASVHDVLSKDSSHE